MRADTASAQTLKTLLTFTGTNGANPRGSLTLSGSTLYGMTSDGGAHGVGAVFGINTDGSGFQTLLSFDVTNGSGPYGSLTLGGSTLYGMTSGGDRGSGNVFKLPVTGGAATVLLPFGATSGAMPSGNLTLSGSTLYGMTTFGGSKSGNVFGISTAGTDYKDLHDFSSTTEGYWPYGSLTLVGSTLYGMTEAGGVGPGYGYGTIFSMPVTGGIPTTLCNFNGTNGAQPYGSLLLSGTTFYGMTSAGGANSEGTVFSLPVTGGTAKTLLSFKMSNGAQPNGSLILNGATLYGMTSHGGKYVDGTIFSINTDGSGFADLFDFGQSALTGRNPYGDLTLSADGKTLYGMTSEGGISNSGGTVFALNLTQVRWAAISGSWSVGQNWAIGSAPNGATQCAVICDSTTSARSITLDVPVTLGTLQLGNSGKASVGYTLSGSGANTLNLNNSGSGATIAVTDGTHAINAPAVMADNLTLTTGGTKAWTLSFGTASSISQSGIGSYSLTMSGTGGTLILSGSNSYTGGTFVTAGLLEVTNPAALRSGTSLTVGANAASIFGGAAAPAGSSVAVPEPSTLALIGVVGVCLVAYRRCQQNNQKGG